MAWVDRSKASDSWANRSSVSDSWTDRSKASAIGDTLLLDDGSSHLLLDDGTSRLLLNDGGIAWQKRTKAN